MTKITYFSNSQKIEQKLSKLSNLDQNRYQKPKTCKQFDKIWDEALKIQQQKQKVLNQKQDEHKKSLNQSNIELLAQKYQPEHYYDLIGQEKNNKAVVAWFNEWRNNNESKDIQQILKPALFWGLPGTGKSTMSKVLAKIYGYQLFVINASSERNGKQLLKKVLDICNTQVITKSWSNDQNNNKVLLVLEEVDGVINSEKNSAIKYLLENIIDPKTKMMKVHHPIIFICNNIYIKGLKTLREAAQVFLFEREKETLIDRIVEVIQNEGKFLERFIVEEISDSFNHDIRSILNYLQLLFLRENFDNKQIRKDLENQNNQDQNYFSALSSILFPKSKNGLRFYYFEEQYVDGIFENYLELEKINNFENLHEAIDLLAHSDMTLAYINGPSQSYQLLKQAYICVPVFQSLYGQKKKFKIQFIHEFINFKQTRYNKRQIYEQIFKNLSLYNNRYTYLDIFCRMLDIEYNSLGTNKKQQKNFATVLMLMIQMGIKVQENLNFKDKEDFENVNDDDNDQSQKFINKQQVQYKLEPNIFQFIDYSQKKCNIKLKRQTLATLKSKWDKVQGIMDVNPQIQPEFIQFDQPRRNSKFSFYKNPQEEEQKQFYLHYKYKANEVSGVYYQLQFDFFL